MHSITVGDILEPLLMVAVDEHDRPIDISGDTMQIKIVDADDADTEVLDWTATNVTNMQVGDGSVPITGTTEADPYSIASTSHGLSTGDRIYIAGSPDGPLNINGNMVGAEEIANRFFQVTQTDDNNFTLDRESGNFHHAWTSGGLIITRGFFRYDWQAADVDTAGTYNIQARRVNTDNETFPLPGTFQVRIVGTI